MLHCLQRNSVIDKTQAIENNGRQHECSESAKSTQYKIMQNNVIGHYEGTAVYNQSDLCYYA